jgi:caa(3)-type oxidase subunit IV
MSASATTHSDHGHAHHPPRELPLLLKPLGWFWAVIQGIWNFFIRVFDGILPGLTKWDNAKEYSPYFAVFTCLMIGSVITVLVALLDVKFGIFLGPTIGWLDLTVGLAIATVKASLVLAFFMHLSHEVKLIYRVLIMTAVFVFFMFFLCILALLDKPPHQDSFDFSQRDPFKWKVPAHGEGHGGGHGEAHGDGHGAAHGNEAHDKAPHGDAAHPEPVEKHAEEVPKH